MIAIFKRLSWRISAVSLLLVLSLMGIGLAAHAHSKHYLASKADQDGDDGGKDMDGGPREAYKWEKMAWLSHGKLDPTGYSRAMTQKRTMHGVHSRIAGDQWVEQGPTNIAGRTISMVMDPTNSNIIFVGTAGGGIWRTLDGGQVWSPVGDQLASLSIGALAIDPENPTTIYAGTGEAYFNEDYIGGNGIYKSADNGTTWTRLAGTTGAGWLDYNVESIAVDPTNSNNILVAGGGGYLGPNSSAGGFLRSTDGGATFNTVLSTVCGDTLEFSPVTPTEVVGTYLNASYVATVAVSLDSGATWTLASTQPGVAYSEDRMVAKFSPTSASTIYVLSDENSSRSATGGIWTSTDTGKTFQGVTTSSNIDISQFWYDFTLWVDPTNPSRMMMGAIGVFETTNGGATITQVGDGYNSSNGYPHPDVHFIAASSGYNGSSNTMVYVCTDGGVFQVPDVTTVSINSGWNSLNFTARTAQYYSVAGDGTAGTIIGGTQDNGTHLLNIGTSTATEWAGGDGFYVAMDPTNANILYGEQYYLNLFTSQQNGQNGYYINSGISDSNNGNDSNFIAPFILDPNNHNTLLAGGASLWRTTDATNGSPSWTAIRSPGGAEYQGSNFLSTIAVAPGNSNVIWVGENDGTVAMTTNGTAASPTWTTIGTPSSGPFPSYQMCTKILVDPSNSQVVYVAFGGFTSNNLWVSTNGGTTWTALNGSGTGTLPQVPIRTIARNPANSQILYLGTEVGIFSTSNGGQTWSAVNDGPANTSVYDLEYLNNPISGKPELIAGTHGRGVWMLENGVSVASLSLNPSSVSQGGSTTGTITLNQSAPAGADVYLTTSDDNASVPIEVTIPAGSTSTTFPVSTVSISGADQVSITASFGLSSSSATLSIGTPHLSSLTLSPSTVGAGQYSTGTVTITNPAPSGGYLVTLGTQRSAYVQVPATVTILAGATTATFTAKPSPYTQTYTNLITASDATTKVSAVLTVNPNGVQSLTLSPSAVYGGSNSTGTITITSNALTGGYVVNLYSQTPSYVGVPSTVTVPAGTRQATFPITSTAYASPYNVQIKAQDSYSTQIQTLTVNVHDSLSSLSFTPNPVTGGNNAVGTVVLTAPAPNGGWTENFSSGIPSYVGVPSSVLVPAGKSSMTFPVTTIAYTRQYVVPITASDLLSKLTTSLTVNLAEKVTALSLNPATVAGGDSSVGTVTVSSSAPAGGVVVNLSSANPTYVGVPSSVTVAAGSTTATFPISTVTYTRQYSAAITATLGGASVKTTLTVNVGDTIASLSLSPSTVVGGSNSSGTITLSAPAPTGGWTVNLTSSNSSVTVPANVTINAGASTGTFTIITQATTTAINCSIRAQDVSSSQLATLTVNP
jgi:hypothetical protein